MTDDGLSEAPGNNELELNHHHQLPATVRSLWMASSLIVPTVAALVILVGLVINPDGWRIPLLVALGVAAVTALLVVAYALARYDRWTFTLTEDWIEASWGVFARRTTLVPRNRVQTISVAHGPIDRFLDLETMVIHTAGSLSPNLGIPHLRPATVATLKVELGGGLDASETLAPPPPSTGQPIIHEEPAWKRQDD